MPKNKPSMTARKVASDFLFKVEDPEIAKLAPAGSISATYDLLEAAGLLKPWMVSLIKAPWYQRFGNALEKPILEGQILHLVLRKRFLDDEVREAMVAGATRPNLHLLGVDLSDRSLADFLGQCSIWSCEARSAVVAEGVLMYLGEEDVRAFLGAVRRCTAAGSRLLTTYVYEGALSGKNLGWLGGALTVFLKLAGEPFQWGVSEHGIEPFLTEQGFRVLGESTRFDLRQRYLAPVGHADWIVARLERVVAAESADFSAG